MPWGTRVVQTVAQGTNSQRFDLKPGETAHVQVRHNVGTDRMMVRALATNEDSPGVAQLDTIPGLEFRIDPGAVVTFIVRGVVAFVIAIDLDGLVGSLSAEVRVQRDGVDLSA